MQRTDFIAPFLAGLGIGAAAAILFAPASGAKTRQRLGEMADRTSDAVKQHAENLTNAANDAVSRGRALFQQGEGVGRKAVNDFQDKARETAHQVGRTMEEQGQRLQSV
jgi:gas vesicle protein